MHWGTQLTVFVVVPRPRVELLLPRLLDLGVCFGLERLPTAEGAYLLHLTPAGWQALSPDLAG